MGKDVIEYDDSATEIDGPPHKKWLDSVETIPFDPSMRVNEADGSLTRDSAMRLSDSQIVGEGTPSRAVPPVRVDSFRPEPTARQVRRAQGTPRPARAPARHPHDNVPTRLNHVDIAGGHVSYSPDPEAYPTPVPLPPLPVAAKHTPRPLHAPYGAPALPPHAPTAMAVPPQAIMPTQIAQPLPAQLPTHVAQQLPALVRPYQDGVTPYPVPPWATSAHALPPHVPQSAAPHLDIYADTGERRGEPTHHVAALPPMPTPSLRPPISRYLLPMIGGTALLVFVAGYFLVRGDGAKRPEAAPIASEAVMPVAAPAPVVSEIVEPQLPDPSWKPREAQPTIVAKTEAIVEPIAEPEPVAEPVAEIEMAPMVAKKKASSSARRAKRAQVAAIEIPKAKPVKTAKKPTKSEKVAKVTRSAKANRDPILEEIEKPAKSSRPKATGPGKLKISSSVPTLIYVDGRSTNLMTPKTLNLSAGTHKITLLDLKSRKAKTLDVDITSGSITNIQKKF